MKNGPVKSYPCEKTDPLRDNSQNPIRLRAFSVTIHMATVHTPEEIVAISPLNQPTAAWTPHRKSGRPCHTLGLWTYIIIIRHSHAHLTTQLVQQQRPHINKSTPYFPLAPVAPTPSRLAQSPYHRGQGHSPPGNPEAPLQVFPARG